MILVEILVEILIEKQALVELAAFSIRASDAAAWANE